MKEWKVAIRREYIFVKWPSCNNSEIRLQFSTKTVIVSHYCCTTVILRKYIIFLSQPFTPSFSSPYSHVLFFFTLTFLNRHRRHHHYSSSLSTGVVLLHRLSFLPFAKHCCISIIDAVSECQAVLADVDLPSLCRISSLLSSSIILKVSSLFSLSFYNFKFMLNFGYDWMWYYCYLI